MRILHVLVGAALFAAACDDTDDNKAPGTPSTPAGSALVVRTNIVTNATDSTLVNAWGMAFNPVGAVWISANGSGLSEVYDGTGKALIPAVTIPPAMSAPTGQVFNPDMTAFSGDKFIFVTEDGVISGWQSGTEAVVRIDNSGANAIYKGLAMANDTTGRPRLFASNFHNGTVDAYDEHYHPMSFSFTDPSLPQGYAPFNVAAINGEILVSYAQQNDMAKDDVKGPGKGFVNRFDVNGAMLGRLISGGELNAPWGMTMSPGSFAAAPARLLVGNFGDGVINVYNFQNGTATHETALKNPDGSALKIDGLWALGFAPAATGGFDTSQLYFTGGPNEEKDGVFGRLATSTASVMMP
jgi:uncharacterized protein (TIGR03118 family)